MDFAVLGCVPSLFVECGIVGPLNHGQLKDAAYYTPCMNCVCSTDGPLSHGQLKGAAAFCMPYISVTIQCGTVGARTTGSWKMQPTRNGGRNLHFGMQEGTGWYNANACCHGAAADAVGTCYLPLVLNVCIFIAFV